RRSRCTRHARPQSWGYGQTALGRVSAPRARRRGTTVDDPAQHSTGATAMPGRAGPTVGELVARLSDQFSRLVRDELKLAQTEIAAKGKKIGVGVGIFAAAALFAFFGMAVLIAAAV